jgi:RNA polymerase sigma-70 factor (sigma-E family)
MTTTALPADFEGFYRAHFHETVAMVYTYTTSRAEAQDIAQEAFARAWQRWPRVSVYDNPVAWVRHVASNLAHTRWRRLRHAAAYLTRQRVEHEPGLSPDHVAVVEALRKLPRAQREAIVLHHLLDVPIAEVALQLDVPAGTVKSWLHRGRNALSETLAIDVDKTLPIPPASEVFKAGTRIRRVRTASAATAIVLLLVGALAAVWIFRPHRPPMPVTPTPRPSPTKTSTVDPNDPMLKVNWFAATITGRLFNPGCGFGLEEQALTFHSDGDWAMIGTRWDRHSIGFLPRHVAYGDLTGDHKAEAVVTALCGWPDQGITPASAGTWVIGRDEAGALRILDIVSSFGNYTWIDDGLLLGPPFWSGDGTYVLGRLLAARWDGHSMVFVDTDDRFPPVRTLDLSGVALTLPCGGLAPRNPGIVRFEPGLTAVIGDRRWTMKIQEEEWAHLGRGQWPYLLTDVSCQPVIEDKTDQGRGLLVLDRTPDGWAVVGFLNPGADSWFLHDTNDRVVTLREYVYGSPSWQLVNYVWDGTTFKRQ